MLDLDRHGIRSIDWTGSVPATYLILAGPTKEKGDTFSLYVWSGDDGAPVKRPLTLPGDFTAEALVVYPEKGLVQILSDDGQEKDERKIPKRKRRFRSIDIKFRPVDIEH